MSENSLFENVDVAELVQHVDIENAVKEVDLWQLLKQVNLESVLGGFGAAAGGELGTRVGRQLDALFGTAEDEPTEEFGDDEDDSSAERDDDATDGDETDDGETEADGTGASAGSEASGDEADPEEPQSREDLEELSYRKLQSLTQDTDVKGNISKERMVEGLAEAFGFDEE